MADDFIQLPGMPHGDKGDGSKTATYAKTQGTDTVHLSRVMIEDDDGAVDLATQTTLITLATEETVATLGTEETLSAISGKLNQDEVVGALVTIETTHHEIHEGEMFSHAEVTNLANGAIRNLLIVTSTKEDHLFFTVTAESECDVKFYEGATASNNGTGISEFNRNRPLAATHTPLTTLFHTPTVAGGAEGTIIYTTHFGSGRGVGGQGRNYEEWILKPSTKYLMRVTNETVNPNQVAIDLQWYEE